MKSGDLRHRLTLLIPQRSTHPQSRETVITYESAGEIAAAVIPQTGRNSEFANQQSHATDYRITTRYNPSITPHCRLRFRGRLLIITGLVNVDQRNRELLINATDRGGNDEAP